MQSNVEKVNAVIQKNLAVPVALDETLRLEDDLGMDSLKRVQLICDIEDAFAVEIAIEDIYPENFATVKNIYDIAEKYCRRK